MAVIGVLVGRNYGISGIILAFNTGFCLGIEMVMLFFITKYAAALRDEDKRKKLYIEENDERSKMINFKTGGTGITVIISGLACATVISGFFNRTVFFTLLLTLLGIVILRLLLVGYYTRKL